MDCRQSKLLEFVLERIRYYYRELYRTKPCYQYPLTLFRLKKLCGRNSVSLVNAVRMLANTVPLGTDEEPPIYYDRIKSEKNKCHRPYRIYLRKA